jgi:hypothetical protein
MIGFILGFVVSLPCIIFGSISLLVVNPIVLIIWVGISLFNECIARTFLFSCIVVTILAIVTQKNWWEYIF